MAAALALWVWALPSDEVPAPLRPFDPGTFIADRPRLDAPYVVSDYAVVDAMLAMAAVRPGELVIDLGSGDGRIPIAAARSHGARGLGVDIDPARVREARANARAARVEERVEFREADLFETDISGADVLTLYLTAEVNLRLRPRILAQMRPGTRVVSHDFHMGEWRFDERRRLGTATLYLWIVPANVRGRWRIEGDGRTGELLIEQDFQALRGAAAGAAGARRIEQGRLNGRSVRFITDIGAGRRAFEGRVENGTMTGDGWRATRL